MRGKLLRMSVSMACAMLSLVVGSGSSYSQGDQCQAAINALQPQLLAVRSARQKWAALPEAKSAAKCTGVRAWILEGNKLRGLIASAKKACPNQPAQVFAIFESVAGPEQEAKDIEKSFC